MPNLWVVFTTGLLTGGIACAAVQGGLLATAIAGVQAKNIQEKNIGLKAVITFLVAKLAVHIIWGGILVGIGTVFVPSIILRGSIVMVLAVYMAGVGLAMWEAHPFFRRFLIQTPGFLRKYIRNTARSGEMIAPALLGAFTVFIPCGITQAMMAASLTSGSALNGALILGVFVVGTTPTFAVIGLTLAKIGEAAQNYLRKAAAVIVVGMAVWTFNSGLVIVGSPINGQVITQGIYCGLAYCKDNSRSEAAVNDVNIEINQTGYKTDHDVILAGKTIKVNLVNSGGSGCQQEFTIPSLNISRLVPPGTKAELEFKAPEEPGILAYSCGMGMYRGQFKVV
jgi:uncharacterized protein